MPIPIMDARDMARTALKATGHSEQPGRRGPASWLILINIVLVAGCVAAGCAQAPADRQTVNLYSQGNRLYETGKYAEAIRTYERIIQGGVRNGHVYYNLGNAYYKQEQIGRAILAYERASRLMPRDDDLQSNLALANERTVDQIVGAVPWSWFGRQAIDAVTVNEATVITTVTGFIASLVLMGYLLARKPRARAALGCALLVVCILLLTSIVFAGAKIYDSMGRDEGIILRPAVVVRTSPDAASEPVFSLHAGAKVQLIEHRDDWLRISLPDGKTGWLPQDGLEKI